LFSANIRFDIARKFHGDHLRARRRRSKRVFVMQATEDRFREDEHIRRQAVAVL
jgi:hypothetical protein